VSKTETNLNLLNDHKFMMLIKAIVKDDLEATSRFISASPGLVKENAVVGASHQAEDEYYFKEIEHYLYAGDTALHMAAAGFRWKIVQDLLDLGANHSARNRRGAEPLHYAADTNVWIPEAQVKTIKFLIQVGANPDAVDKNGVAPLHRAVRTRSAPAVEALLAGGADSRIKNKSGSTPLHLAVQKTGRGGSGSTRSLEQQRQIILLLLQNGAKLSDKNVRGKSVEESITSDWIRDLLKFKK